ncbi:MmyB family transcriptional regulator [Frankia sp. AgKG'84/4]|uniref:MmyB family transcriptional regulator n=1 Tax=Frankia sp. AgKG'84/4 TaxID=573490 RepID=UPI0035AFA6C3
MPAVWSDPARIPVFRRNLRWCAVGDHTVRNGLTDWEPVARAILAQFRAQTVRRGADRRTQEIYSLLRADFPALTQWWECQGVEDLTAGEVRVTQPAATSSGSPSWRSARWTTPRRSSWSRPRCARPTTRWSPAWWAEREKASGRCRSRDGPRCVALAARAWVANRWACSPKENASGSSTISFSSSRWGCAGKNHRHSCRAASASVRARVSRRSPTRVSR